MALLQKITCNLRHPMCLRHPVAHDSFTCATWLIHMFDVFHDLSIRKSVTWLVCTCDVTPRENGWILWREIRVLDTWWRRPLGCLKLQVIFRKRATYYRALLRKITYEDEAPYDTTPLCSMVVVISSSMRQQKTVVDTHTHTHAFVCVWVCVGCHTGIRT